MEVKKVSRLEVTRIGGLQTATFGMDLTDFPDGAIWFEACALDRHDEGSQKDSPEYTQCQG